LTTPEALRPSTSRGRARWTGKARSTGSTGNSTGCAAQQEVLAECREIRLRGLHAAYVLDEKLECDVDEAAIEATATQADRQRHRSDLADGARREGGSRAHDALR